MFNIRDLLTNNIECHNALMQFVESGNCGKLYTYFREYRVRIIGQWFGSPNIRIYK